MRRPLVLALMTSLLAGLAADGAPAQSGALLAPAEVALYTPPALKSRSFLPPLVCALRRVLVAPVRTAEIDISFTRDMLATPSQLDVNKVFNHFIRNGAGDGTQTTFKYLLLPYDLKAESLNYVFATSYGNQASPYHGGIVSTARLDIGSPFQDHPDGAKITALRAYKLILKSIARVAGLTAPQGCILAFPRSLPELDQKPAEFCPGDRDTLVAAGILKAEEKDSGDCVVVADRRESPSPATAFAFDVLAR
jgi:predicted Zn-dependent protease